MMKFSIIFILITLKDSAQLEICHGGNIRNLTKDCEDVRHAPLIIDKMTYDEFNTIYASALQKIVHIRNGLEIRETSIIGIKFDKLESLESRDTPLVLWENKALRFIEMPKLRIFKTEARKLVQLVNDEFVISAYTGAAIKDLKHLSFIANNNCSDSFLAINDPSLYIDFIVILFGIGSVVLLALNAYYGTTIYLLRRMINKKKKQQTTTTSSTPQSIESASKAVENK